MYNHKQCVNAGSAAYGDNGCYWGRSGQELDSFIQPSDTITIVLNYQQNTISFHSLKRKQIITKDLKDGVDVVQFVVEFRRYHNCTIRFI